MSKKEGSSRESFCNQLKVWLICTPFLSPPPQPQADLPKNTLLDAQRNSILALNQFVEVVWKFKFEHIKLKCRQLVFTGCCLFIPLVSGIKHSLFTTHSLSYAYWYVFGFCFQSLRNSLMVCSVWYQGEFHVLYGNGRCVFSKVCLLFLSFKINL